MDQFAAFLGCLDYWAARYQSLIAAIIALAGVYYAVQPVRRQLSLLEAQNDNANRERLLASYRMLAKAIDVLSYEDWRSAVKFTQRPEDPASLELEADLLPAYEARKVLWRQVLLELKNALTPEELQLIQPELDFVKMRFEECDEALASGEKMQHMSQRWFYACEMPDLMVSYRMDLARRLLEKEASKTVAKIAKPSAG